MARAHTESASAPRDTALGRARAKGLSAIGVLVLTIGLAVGLSGPATASPSSTSSFPTTVAECRHGGWKHFDDVSFHNRHQCVRWIRSLLRHEHCLPAALEDFADTGAIYAREVGMRLHKFLKTVCHGQDFPVSNASFAVNDPAGTDLLSLDSGNTAPFVTKRHHIYWIEVQGDWDDGTAHKVDASYTTTDDWTTWDEGPSPDARNLETQINDRFVEWGPYNSGHNYSYWIVGDGNPINMRVFEGVPATNTPYTAGYADNTGWVAPGSGADEGLPAIVFEYSVHRH